MERINSDRHIFRIVFYDAAHGGYFYKVTEFSPMRGPFNTQASAAADAAFHLNEDMKAVSTC